MALVATDHLRHFTDREPQIAAFDALWSNSAQWVIVYTGLSGHGKSTLIDWLITRKCQSRDIYALKIDLFNGLNPVTILDKLAELLPPNAAEHYRAARDAATRDYQQSREQLLLAAAARPIQAIQQASDHSQISQAEIHIQTGQAQAQEELTRLYHERLTIALTAELFQPSPKQAVIFLDTYERAQENSPATQLAWLWELLAATYQARPNLRLVAANREDIAYPPAQAWRTRQPLEAFSLADSDHFLLAWSEGQLPPELRTAIFDLAQGQPLLTEMAAELWRDGQQTGRPLTLAELRAGLEHRSAEEWLYGRIINRLDPRLAAAARYGPLLRHFNLRSLNALLPEGIERLDDAAFRRFTTYAFVKKIPGGWVFHELMRIVQQAYLARQDDPEVEACHRRMAAFFQERTEATRDPEAGRNALYHACFLEPDAMFDQADDATFSAQLAGEGEWWAELLAVLEAPAQSRRLQPLQQGRLAQRRGMWHVRHYNMNAALTSYAQALDLFRAVGSRLGEANTLLAMGDMARAAQEWLNSKTHYDQTLAIYQAIGDRYSQARALYRLGDWHAAQNQKSEAVYHYQQASTIWSAIGLDDLVEQILNPRLQAVSD